MCFINISIAHESLTDDGEYVTGWGKPVFPELCLDLHLSAGLPECSLYLPVSQILPSMVGFEAGPHHWFPNQAMTPNHQGVL